MEFRLASCANRQDALAAEFIRSFRCAPFDGQRCLQLLSSHANNAEMTLTKDRSGRPRVRDVTSFLDVYGYRGRHPSLYYLSAWEFTKWWFLEEIKAPSAYKSAAERLTEWTEAGEAAREAGGVGVGQYKAGEHY